MRPFPRVLVVDGDPAIGRLLRVCLGGEHFRVLWRRSGAEAVAEAAASPPAVVILELELPDGDGLAVFGALRDWSRAPAMILSARTAPADIVRALDAGADDYMVKPFAPEELVARVRVLLRGDPPARGGPARARAVFPVDAAGREAIVDGRRLELSGPEAAVLRILARHAGELIPAVRLARAALGAGKAERILELHARIAQLRRKLEAHGGDRPISIQEEMGYRLVPAPGRGRPAVPAPQAPLTPR